MKIAAPKKTYRQAQFFYASLHSDFWHLSFDNPRLWKIELNMQLYGTYSGTFL